MIRILLAQIVDGCLGTLNIAGDQALNGQVGEHRFAVIEENVSLHIRPQLEYIGIVRRHP